MRVKACKDCGFVHQDPLPDAGDVAEMYRAEYYQTMHAGRYAKEKREWRYWRRVYSERMRKAERWLPDVFGKMYRVLDVGTGYGWFLIAARESKGTTLKGKAWDFWAMEPNEVAHKRLFASGFGVARGLEDSSALISFVDFMHCSFVLEHLIDPFDALHRMWKMLRPGGILCIVTPNEFNPYQVRMREMYGYTPYSPEHINYFSQINIQALLDKAGFEILDIENTFPMEWFALMTPLNYVIMPWMGPIAHWLRMIFEWSLMTFAPKRMDRLRHRWAEQGIGRETIVWARKV